MFKRKLFKRALPFILSVAMMFESLPATAMATESSGAEQMTETERQSEEGGEERSGSEESAEAESGSEVESLRPSDEAAPTSEATPTSEESESTDSKRSTESETPSTSEEPSGSESETPSTSEGASGSESGSESETPPTSEESSGSEQEDEREEIEQKEVDAEETANKKYETEIRIAENLGVGDDNNIAGFERILEGEDSNFKFSAKYRNPSQCGALVEALKNNISVWVDDEKVEKDDLDQSITERLEFEWKAKKADSTATGAEAYTETVGTPIGVGDYMLTITLPAINELCEKKAINVFVKVDYAEIRLDLKEGSNDSLLRVDPGTTVGEFIDNIKNGYMLQYKNTKEDLFVDKTAVKSFEVTVHESNVGEDTPLETDAVFSAKKEYFAHITVVMNDETCYKVDVADAYKVEVGELQATRVDVKLDKEAYTATYGDADLAALIKPESGYPKVFVLDKDGDDAKELTSADAATPIAELGWYRREQDNKNDNWPANDEITDTTVRYEATEQKGWKYVKLDDVPTEAGDYYLIWKYAGDEQNAYEQSVSTPVSFTLEPAPVAITIAQDEATLGKMFYEGMDQEDVKKVLSQIEYKVSTVNKEGVVDATSDIKTDTFFGTGYVGDAQEDSATVNFKPLFELQRRVKAEKKNGTMTPVEEKEEDWKSPYVDDKLIKKDDDHEYQYRIKFTGDKVLYDKNGEIAKRVSVTQLSTDSADRNHLAKVDVATLAANARKFDIEAATEAVIDTKAIIDEFNGKTNSKNTGDGTLEKPAVKIYDENALFADRASYKKATVTANGSSVSGNLKYTWKRTDLEAYEKYMEETEEDKKANPFDKRVDDDGNSIWDDFYGNGIDTSVDDGSLLNETADAKLYELTIRFDDETNTYRAKDAKLYFVVEPQQIIIAPGEQVAQDGQDISNWKNGDAGNASLDKSQYTVYRLPNNDRAEFDAATDKTQYEIVLRMHKESEPVVLSKDNFVVMNKEKGADGKEVYVDTKHDVFNKAEYTYGVTARIRDKYSNYTSVDKANSVGGETKYHDLPGEIKFLGNGTLYPSIDKEALKSLTKWYDGNPITLPEGLIKLYSNKEMTSEVKDLLNTTAEYDPAKVNVYWLKKGTGKYYSTEDVVWGGDYALVLRFKGNDEYKPLRVDNEGSESGENYNEWVVFSNDDDYMFSIKKLAITIAPELKSEADLKAGDTVDTLLQKQLVVTGVLPKDEEYFQYAESKKELLEKYWTSKKLENGVTTWYQVDASVEENKDLKDDWWGYSYELDKNGGYPAFGYNPGFIFQVDDKKVIQEAERQYLRCNRKYTVNFATQTGLIDVLADSYEVTYLSASQNVVNRGHAEIAPVDTGVGKVSLKYEYDGKTYSIRPLEAIPYVYGATEADSGNFVAYKIYAPEEFEGDIWGTDFNKNSGKFILDKSIKEIGGKFQELDWVMESMDNTLPDDETGDNMGIVVQRNSVRHYRTVLLPVTEDDKERSFDITWEDGYTDTFKLVNAELEADLKEAVAPKSISFNGVQSKMAVGETQQLDVKIKKAQLGDVVKIQYRIAGTTDQTKNEFISIDPDTGVVTALHTAKKATTQIEAYPVYRDKTGKLVEITGKKVKKAKTKITVTNVGVPTIKKVISKDVIADVQFKEVADGYRREIYVVEAPSLSAAKKMKPAQFESMIAGVKNGLYKEAGFALNPIYDPEKTAYYDKKTKSYSKTIGNRNDRFESSPEQLIPGKTYAVYVRNVSAPRTLDDGSVVDLAYNGSVKSFVATKSQVQSLQPYFQVNDDNTPVAKSAVKYLVTGYNEDGTEIFDKEQYQVDLFSKSAQVSLDGLFWDAEGGNDAAELQDQLKFALPLTKDKQARYLNPKLTYGIFDTYPSRENGKFTTPVSKYATINKKGKISLKGVDLDGEKTVYVCVLADNGVVGSVRLTIKADASSVTGKKAKLNVGETRPLSDFLDYKQGKKKVPNYISTRISISDDTIQSAAAAGYKIEDGYDRYVETLKSEGHYVNEYYDWDEKPEYHYWYITAVSPNKQAFTLNFTDRQNNGTDITVTKPVTLTSAAIRPVKNLKVSYVDDKNITINFKHTGNPQGYEIAVVDARKNVIEKKYIDAKNYDIVKKDAKPYLQNYQKWMVNEDGRFDHELVYFEKTKTYAYTISNPKLLRLSTYTVTVTPVYENQRPKTITKKVKTTNIPASKENVDVSPSGMTGMDIFYVAKGDGRFEQNGVGDDIKEINLRTDPYFQAGNVYTLRADANDDAKNRVTDTLTWKSSNTKVATIKANAGKYTATFKPLKTGETTISVTSKITKKVIARWVVRVKAIGNGEGFGGDFEPSENDEFYHDFLAKWDPFYAGRLEVLSVTNPLTLKLKAYERIWVTFTAPTFGEYDFKDELDLNLVINVYDSKTSNNVLGADSGAEGIFLEAGQKVYMSVETPEGGTFKLSATSTNFARMTEKNDSKDNAIVVNNEWVAFTAPEENYYSFITEKLGGTITFRKDNVSKDPDDVPEFIEEDKKQIGKAYKVALKAGETIFIKAPAGKLWVTYRKTELKLDTEKNKTQTVKISKDALTQFVKFTAPVAGRYDFTVSYDKLITTELFTARGKDDQIDKGSFDYETVVNALAADGDDANKPVEKKVSVYMSIGDTLIFSFKVNDVTTLEEVDKDGKKTGNYKTPEATVSVVAPTINELKVNTAASAAKATVTSFKFEIPKDANVQYAFVLSGITAKYYDEEGRALDSINSFVVKTDGTVDGIMVKGSDAKLKAGAKIFVEATNEDKNNEGKIEVVQVKADKLEADKPKEFDVSDKNSGFWYTFTAPAEGVYEFTHKVHDNADATKGKHSVSFDEYDELFGKRLRTLANEKVMMANETIAIYVKAAPENDAELTTKVTLTATTRKPTELKLGKNETAELAKAGEKAYYQFIAPANDLYSFEWANAENVTSTVTMGKNLKNPNESLANPVWLNAGEVQYIKVFADTDKAKGSITVTGKKDSSVLLESGEAKPFEIKADDTNKTRRFRFTAAREDDTEYSVITTVDEGKENPTIMIGGISVSVPAGKIPLKKGQTITIELTGTDTTGNIKVQPIVPATATPITAATTTVKTSAEEYAFYSYKVPKYGRYHFEVTTEGENSAWIDRSYKNSNKQDAVDGGLYDTNDVIYFVVATGNVKEQTATLKVEEITAIAEADKAIENVTIAPGRYVYYVFTAPEHAYYDFTKMEPAEGKNVGEVEGVYKYNEKYSSSLGTSSILLDKDDKVLIKLTAKMADVQFKYTVEKKPVNVLTLDTASTPTIKAGESVRFEFPVKSEGIYAFSIAGKGMNVSGLTRNSRTITTSGNTLFNDAWYSDKHEDAHYIVNEYHSTNASDVFTITNSTEADAQVTVKVTKIEPKKLTADAETEISITKGECAIVSFVPTVSARYAFTTGNDNVKLDTRAFEEEVLDKDDTRYKTMVLYVTDNEKGDNKSETTKVKVTTVKPTEITGSQTYTATGAKMTYWYEFKANNNAKYEFELNNGKADAEKAPIAGTISKYEELRKETHTTLTSELMKAGDKILVKVEIPASVPKDTGVKLDIKETKVDDFKEVVFTEASGDTKESGYFVAKKDESYTVTIINKGNAEATAVAEYIKNKEEKKDSITFTGKQAEYKFKNDTEADIDINVMFTLTSDKGETTFYVFVEKDPKPETPAQPNPDPAPVE